MFTEPKSEILDKFETYEDVNCDLRYVATMKEQQYF